LCIVILVKGQRLNFIELNRVAFFAGKKVKWAQSCHTNGHDNGGLEDIMTAIMI